MTSFLRARRVQVGLGLAVVALVALVVVLTGGDSGETSTRPSDATTTTTAPTGSIDLEVGEVHLASVADGAELPDAAAQTVVDLTHQYVQRATIVPLLSGGAAKRPQDLFAADVAGRVAPDGPDRPALTDEGLPPATVDLETSASPVAVDGLANADGTVVLLATSTTFDVDTVVDGGPLAIHRVVQLYFRPDAERGWAIAGYEVAVARTTDDGTTTTTAAASSTTLPEAP